MPAIPGTLLGTSCAGGRQVSVSEANDQRAIMAGCNFLKYTAEGTVYCCPSSVSISQGASQPASSGNGKPESTVITELYNTASDVISGGAQAGKDTIRDAVDSGVAAGQQFAQIGGQAAGRAAGQQVVQAGIMPALPWIVLAGVGLLVVGGVIVAARQ